MIILLLLDSTVPQKCFCGTAKCRGYLGRAPDAADDIELHQQLEVAVEEGKLEEVEKTEPNVVKSKPRQKFVRYQDLVSSGAAVLTECVLNFHRFR